ncbi:MAG: dehydrogenase, partial [Cyclobacteriaceae bacterium]|nr:dehydrogenase [Cyclobacteriaceae bacterium]
VMYQFDRTKENNPYQTEHDELFAAIAKKEYKFSDTENGAMTTMTAILGRLATYTGQVVEFEKALNSGMSIMPTKFDFNAQPPVLPNEDGFYPVAIPGVTSYFS